MCPSVSCKQIEEQNGVDAVVAEMIQHGKTYFFSFVEYRESRYEKECDQQPAEAIKIQIDGVWGVFRFAS